MFNFKCWTFCLLLTFIKPVFASYYEHEFVLEPGINSLIVMPNESKTVIVSDDFTVTDKAPWFSRQSEHVFHVIAPHTPGFYRLGFGYQGNSGTVLQVIVKTPIDTAKQGKLNNYQINTYPSAYKGLATYRPPQGLIEISKADEALFLSDIVQVKNVMCKQTSGYPKYVLVTTEGLKMLNRLRDYLLEQGVKFNRFSFISGYRTPYYNKMIGNGRHSRHQFGDAFDLYIDADGDSRMDDLNGDGKQDKKDVDYLYQLFVAFLKHDDRLGGVGKYYPNSRHGGFVHIDNRGFTARW